jgi:hypothetical protein
LTEEELFELTVKWWMWALPQDGTVSPLRKGGNFGLRDDQSVFFMGSTIDRDITGVFREIQIPAETPILCAVLNSNISGKEHPDEFSEGENPPAEKVKQKVKDIIDDNNTDAELVILGPDENETSRFHKNELRRIEHPNDKDLIKMDIPKETETIKDAMCALAGYYLHIKHLDPGVYIMTIAGKAPYVGGGPMFETNATYKLTVV